MLRTHEELQMKWFRAKGEISGGHQQQDTSGNLTIVRRSHLQSHGNGHVSQARNASRTRIYPKILLRRRKYDITLYVNRGLG
jgi:hypothetical protein